EAERTGGRIVTGRCHESERVLSFGPWIAAFRGSGLADEPQLLRALRPLPRAELARLPPQGADAPPGPSPPPPLQLFAALAQVLERLALDRPLLLILEDLQWADEMTLRLLAFVGRRLPRSRILGLVTARAEDLPDAGLLRRTLDELAEGAHLIRCSLGPLAR